MIAKTPVTPIFIFSLVRSGSTLLQRMLATHPKIATMSEPYILLPLVYMTKERGVYAEYGHDLAAIGIRDFDRDLGGFSPELRDFVLSLYEKGANGADFFVDKTPAYCFIVDEIMELFPEAHAVFLWRNPLAMIASTIESLPHYGRWNLYNKWDSYFTEGLTRLIAASKKYADRAVVVQFEQLVSDPETITAPIFETIGLDPTEADVHHHQSVKLKSWNVGDKQGRKTYQDVSDKPLEKWKSILNSPLRLRWCRRYLRWLGKENLTYLGYDFDQLMSEMNGVTKNWARTPSDAFWMLFGAGYRLFEYRLTRHKLQDFRAGKEIFIHT